MDRWLVRETFAHTISQTSEPVAGDSGMDGQSLIFDTGSRQSKPSRSRRSIRSTGVLGTTLYGVEWHQLQDYEPQDPRISTKGVRVFIMRFAGLLETKLALGRTLDRNMMTARALT